MNECRCFARRMTLIARVKVWRSARWMAAIFFCMCVMVCARLYAAELNIWVMSTTAQPQQDMREILRPYLQSHPDLRVNVTVLNWENAWAKINAAVESGQGPDIVELGSTWVAAIAAQGALETLTSAQIAEVGGSGAFFPALWSSTHRLRADTVFALPWYGGARVAYYRSDLFKRAGINPSEAFANWSSFKQAMRKLNGMNVDGKKVAALGYPGRSDSDILHNLAPWIWNAGGDFLRSDHRATTINSPEVVQAIAYYTSFADEGLVPASALEKDSAQIESGFFYGQYAVIFSGPWVLKVLNTPKSKGGQLESVTAQNFGVASYPAGIKGNQTLFSGSDLAIMRSSKNKKEAWQLLKYLLSRDAQLQFSQRSGMLPARLDVAHDPALLRDPHYAEFVEQVKLGRHYPVLPAWGRLEKVFRTSISQIVTARNTVKGAHAHVEIKKNLDDASHQANAILVSETR